MGDYGDPSSFAEADAFAAQTLPIAAAPEGGRPLPRAVATGLPVGHVCLPPANSSAAPVSTPESSLHARSQQTASWRRWSAYSSGSHARRQLPAQSSSGCLQEHLKLRSEREGLRHADVSGVSEADETLGFG